MRGLRQFPSESLAPALLAAGIRRARQAAPVRVICRVLGVLLPTAVFSAVAQGQDYTLTVTGAGTGNGTVTAPVAASQPAINCTITAGTTAGSCRGTYPFATRVTLTAQSTGTSTFAGWSGVCTVTAADCVVRNETGAVSATATFAVPAPTCTLIIGTATGGSAAVTSGSLTGACGRSVTLTATPAAGYRFGSWTGGETTNPLTLVVSAPTSTVTPSFVQQCTLTLTATPSTGGTATLTAGTAAGDCGRSVTALAAPSAAFVFTSWSDGITTASRAVIVSTVSQSLTATFTATPAQCTIVIGTATGGTAALTTGAATGTCGRSVSVTATPASGYRFGAWTDGSTANPLTIVVNTPTSTVTPSFVQQCTLSLAATPATGGAATLTAGALTGDCGRAANALATPSADFTFTSWSDGITAASRAVTVNTVNQSLTATFTATPPPQCTIVLGAVTGGVAVLTSGTAVGVCGRSVSVTATPASGYRFGSWTGGSTANPLTLVVSTTTVTIAPSFIQQCTLTLAVTPANGGTATLTAGATAGDCNRSVTASASPNADFTFTRWSDGITTAARAVIVASVNQVLTATFAANAPPASCTIAVGTATGGTAALTSGGATGLCGRNVTVTATSDVGYRFDGWSDGATATPYTFALTTQSLTIAPRFVQQCTLVLAVSPADGGTTRITPEAVSGDCGRNVVADATPNANFVLVNWSDGSTASSRAFTISQPRQTLTATFARVLSVRVVVSGTLGSVIQLRSGRTACATTDGETEHVCPLNLTGPDSLVAVPTATSGFTGWSGACSGRTACAVTGTETDEVRAVFIVVPAIAADDAAKDLLTGSGLTADQRVLLDKAGNGDGTFNLGDLIAHLERTNQILSPSITAQLLSAPVRARASSPRTAKSPTSR